MCGIAGFTTYNTESATEQSLQAMGNAILHRGPDAGKTYIDNGVGLVHRRLAIIDLSEAGVQPMFSADGRYVIVFNGEIYNFQQHREQLLSEGVTFNTHTDTEVILALYSKHGEQCLDKINGMFAFAIWDTQEQTLFIARDRLGKKPLYYYQKNGELFFASELKSLMAIDAFPRKVRTDAVFDFFAYQYVPDPKTIFEDVYKLEPGHCMTVTNQGVAIRKYWDVSFANQTEVPMAEAKQQLYDLLLDCTKNRMVSDVPLGAFLSGGVDSSGVVALMSKATSSSSSALIEELNQNPSSPNAQFSTSSSSALVEDLNQKPSSSSAPIEDLQQNNTETPSSPNAQFSSSSPSASIGDLKQHSSQITTCSIGFDDPKFNETEFARTVAEQYNTNHHEFTVHQNVKDNLAHIVKFFDEPFADPSLVPTYFVSELARQKVTVAVAGDGGDEVFAGYEKYSVDHIENKLRNKFPSWLRTGVFPALSSICNAINVGPFKRASSLFNTLSVDPAMGFYITNSFITDSTWDRLVNDKTSEQLGDYHPSKRTVEMYNQADGQDHLSKILYTDMKTYLPGGILVKVDRMSMANSLEVRAPILDYTVVEASAKLPSNYKFNVDESSGKTEKKFILKEIFKPLLPKA